MRDDLLYMLELSDNLDDQAIPDGDAVSDDQPATLEGACGTLTGQRMDGEGLPRCNHRHD